MEGPKYCTACGKSIEECNCFPVGDGLVLGKTHVIPSIAPCHNCTRLRAELAALKKRVVEAFDGFKRCHENYIHGECKCALCRLIRDCKEDWK